MDRALWVAGGLCLAAAVGLAFGPVWAFALAGALLIAASDLSRAIGWLVLSVVLLLSWRFSSREDER